MKETLERRVRVACWLGLFAVASILWSLLDPRPAVVFLAMSAGQVAGTASFALYCVWILGDRNGE